MIVLFDPKFVAKTFLTGFGAGVLALLALLHPAHAQYYTATSYASGGSPVAPVAAATDVGCIVGAANRQIKVNRVVISGFSATAVSARVALIRRTTANAGGTFTAQPSAPYNPLAAATGAVVNVYTGNPAALGTSAGTVMEVYYLFGVATAIAPPYTFDLTASGSQGAVLLKSAADSLCVNLNAATVTAGGINMSFQFTD